MITMKEVESSNIKAIGYSANQEILQIEFHNRGNPRTYRFYKVPKSVHMNMMKANSFGKFFHNHIVKVYDYEEMK